MPLRVVGNAFALRVIVVYQPTLLQIIVNLVGIHPQGCRHVSYALLGIIALFNHLLVPQ